MSNENYVVRAVPTEITATSRCALRVKDNYYTIEVSEKRTINADDLEGIDMDKEYEALFNEVNDVVDRQCEQIVKTFTK